MEPAVRCMRKLVEPLVNEGAIVLSRRGPDPAPNHPHVQQFLEAGGGKSRNIHESPKVGDGKS